MIRRAEEWPKCSVDEEDLQLCSCLRVYETGRWERILKLRCAPGRRHRVNGSGGVRSVVRLGREGQETPELIRVLNADGRGSGDRDATRTDWGSAAGVARGDLDQKRWW